MVYSGYSVQGGTEDLPYAKKPLDFFIWTKILQEKVRAGWIKDGSGLKDERFKGE